ncbi:MAG: 4Fe-4S dicluster domain-containing protein [Candidatus Omnitrophica bacterium]|nr:4Fe-4S dicluster domain-containing protein [Candidatus Omnitrophota bacterium]
MKRIFIDVERCLGCKTCEMICAIKHSKSKNLLALIEDEVRLLPRIKVIKTEISPLPLQCRHCPEPYCKQACISGAIEIKEDTVLIDKEKCINCYSCIMVCPYGVIRIDREESVAIKCDLCPDEEIPPCVRSCPTKALFYGELKDFKKRIKKEERCPV